MVGRLRYAGRMLVGRASRRVCPSCRSPRSEMLLRKRPAVEIRRCSDCDLFYRWPLDRASATRLYEHRYREGLTTELPSPPRLAQLLADRFVGTPHDMAAKIGLLTALAPPPRRVLDFGASWGYGTWQLERAGYEAFGYEVSRQRAAFAASVVGVNVSSSWADLPAKFDVIYSNHVLEHVGYDIYGTLERLAAACGEDAMMMHVVPHFGGYLARGGLAPMMGEVHPVGPTARSLDSMLRRLGFPTVRISTGPFEPGGLRPIDEVPAVGEELLVLASRGTDVQ